MTNEARFTPQGCEVWYRETGCAFTCFCNGIPHVLKTHAVWTEHYKEKFSEPVSYVCADLGCQRAFSSYRAVAQHRRRCNFMQPISFPMNMVTALREQECSMCAYRSRNKRGLSRHIKSEHPMLLFERFVNEKRVDRRWSLDEMKTFASKLYKVLSERQLKLDQVSDSLVEEAYARSERRLRKSIDHVKSLVKRNKFTRMFLALASKKAGRVRSVTPELEEEQMEVDPSERQSCDCSNAIQDGVWILIDQALSPILPEKRARQALRRDLRPRPGQVSMKVLDLIYKHYGEGSELKPKRCKGQRKSRTPADHTEALNKLGSKAFLSHLCNPGLSDLKPSQVTLEWFGGQFERDSIDDAEPVSIINRDKLRTCLFHSWICEEEVKFHLSSFDIETASGSDGFSVVHLKSLPSKLLTMLMNLCLLAKDVPNTLKQNRTTLLAKKPNPGERDWRPITVSSVLYRLFSKIITLRLEQEVTINPQQRAFLRSIDGCSENISVVTEMIKRANAGKGPLMVCSLDLAKAFDSVSFSSTIRALRRQNVDDQVLQLIGNLLVGNETTVGGSYKAQIRRGVRQGDPISPLLFNLVMDELFGLLKDKHGAPYPTRDGIGGKISAVAFADDITLLCESQRGLERQISTCVKFFNRRGMKINIGKSSVLAIDRLPESDIITPLPIVIEVKDPETGRREVLPCLGPLEELRVLGAYINGVGQASFKIERLSELLRLVENSNLMSFDKVGLIRHNLVPMFKHQIFYGGISTTSASIADKAIRRSLRSIMKMPKQVCSAFFRLPISHGGLGIESLARVANFQRTKQQLMLLHSDREASRELVPVAKLRDWYLQCNIIAGRHEEHDFDSLVYWTAPEEDYLENRLKQVDADAWRLDCRTRLIKLDTKMITSTVQGAAFQSLARAPYEYLIHPERYNLELGKIDLVYALRLGTLQVLANSKRDLANRRCRLCKSTLETQMHVLQECTETKRWQIERHNAIVALLYHELIPKLDSDRETAVVKEPSIVVDNGPSVFDQVRLQPDILVVNPKRAIKGKLMAAAIDVACVYEQSGSSLGKAYSRKRQKYETLKESLQLHGNLEMLGQKLDESRTELVMGNRSFKGRKYLTKDRNMKCQVFPFVVGVRSGWLEANMDLFEKLGIRASPGFKNRVMRTTAERSINIFKKFMGRVRAEG